MTLKPTTTVRLVAAWFLFWGLAAIIRIFSRYPEIVLSLDFSLLGIPIGIGLLIFSERWRRFAVFSQIAILLLVPAILIWFFIMPPGQATFTSPWTGKTTELSRPLSFLIVTIVLGLSWVFSFWVYRALIRSDVKDCFLHQNVDNPVKA
jgi:hypothetical protein